MAASATFALKPGVWFRRGRLLMVSPDKMGTACPLSGRNSTYRPVQISGTGSDTVREMTGSDGFKVGAQGCRSCVVPKRLPYFPLGWAISMRLLFGVSAGRVAATFALDLR